ncbi:DUF2345 domain-containing protein [Paraburkholderia nodosa]|uniref:DUF2345 domain-containing protein n=1 Tax=Paraburkholderia nodosa TaxID=392320 RepID=UPI000486DC97|nr:DUF2345 domain-containing protein [Paraburkholderia nodosa]
MNAVTQSFTEALRHPSARLTRHFKMWIGGHSISMCSTSHELRLKFVAAKGKLLMAAFTGGMDPLRVASESADVQVSANTKLTLNCGGASVVLEDGNVTFHCPGA